MLETLVFLISVVATGIAGLSVFLVFYARRNYGSLEKLGIPVAPPHFLLGSDPDGHKVVFQQRDIERFKKYGPVFGVYEGSTPRVFVLDPDMIRKIMVKDFNDHFYDRSQPDWGHEFWNNLLDFLPGEKWKTVRSGLTPIFTASRIRHAGKNFVTLMEKYVNELKMDLKEKNGMRINTKEFMTPVFVEFTSDYFLSIKLKGNVKENFVYKMVLESVNDEEEASFMFTLLSVYPFIIKLFTFFSTDGITKFIATLDQVIKTRRESKSETSGGKDFIDIMIAMLDNVDSAEYKRLGIDKTTIQAQAFEMFVAGFDSIIGTLSVIPYYLAKNPDIQDKVLDEIDQNFSMLDGKTDQVPELPYLAACVKEAIRLNPSFHRLERLCMKDWTYNENGYNFTIPKGMSVNIPAYATNRNPGAFKDPDEFIPERFFKNDSGIDGTQSGKEEHNRLMQFSFASFGHGPRNCPGSRLGIEMIKAGMARLLQEFRFECRDDTKLEIQEGIPSLTRFKPIYVDFVKRNEE